MDRRIVVLTGATRGLGRAMTDGLIARGHTVLGCGRTKSALDELHKQHPAPHRFYKVDVSDDRQTRRWAESLLAEYGPPDLLINNAAVINANAPLWKVAARDFDYVIDVNIKGIANVIRWFVPAMVERGSGVIVNFSSGWGRSTSPEVAPYCATKWAVEGLTQALAAELPGGMAAVALNPGIIDTEMLRRCFGDEAGRYPTPSQWAAKAVPFLLEIGRKHNGKPLTVPG
jgi:NAD(P)-dependent dehydrogenase (short-subunit alcohol dehydrogenase family)